MRSFSSWLERNGLAQYSEMFAREAIDLDVLPTLSDEDLRELGLPLGHRRKLLDAIAKLVAEEKRGAQGWMPSTNSASEPERRQVTFLFCDLINSTSLSRRLDPEDLCDLIGAYQQACTPPIEHYGGYVARYIGDGILAYFGYPVAHENDAERAVRAGLGIVEAMDKFNNRGGREITEPLAVRIGISTGDVVIGYTVGRGAAEENAVAGEAVNLAAKLQQLAKPNTVVVSSVTRQLTAERFEYRDGREHQIAGFEKPVRYWPVIGDSDIRRLEVGATSLATFVGRREEVSILLRQWKSAALGQGQAALVEGRAGIGKSRLIATVTDHILRVEANATQRVPLVLSFTCSPFRVNTAFYPIIQQIVLRAAVDLKDTYEINFRKLSKFLAESGLESGHTSTALIADLLGIRADERRPTLAIGPREKRLRTLETLQNWFESLSLRQPLLLIFEDIQWIDHSSGQLLGQVVAWAANASALILITHRSELPERKNPSKHNELTTKWLNLPHFTVCELDQLNDSDAKKLLCAAAGGKIMPAHVIDDILQKAEGVPLYIEELTRGLIDSPLLEDTGPEYVMKRPLASMSIPSTLSGALTARLDQLGPAKEIAQLASVIGREFSMPLLSTISAYPHDRVLSGLDRLLATGIITRGGNAWEPVYAFRHALIQEAAYRSLLRRKRSEMHLRLADRLERDKRIFSDVTDELIAEHYDRGGAKSQAIAARRRAAATAIARSAQVEAANLLEIAVATLADLPRDTEYRQLELELTMELASALGAVRGYAAPTVERQYLKARDLCLDLGNSNLRFNAEFGLMISNLVKGDLKSADEFAKPLFEHAEHHPNKPHVDAYLANGMVKMQQGRLQEARSLLEKGAKLACPEEDGPHFFTHGQNPGILCRSYLAHALAFMGHSQEAIATVESTLALARRRTSNPSHIYTYVNALAFAARVHLLLRNSSAVIQFSRELIDIARRNQYSYFEAIGRIQQSWALATPISKGSLQLGARQMVEGLKVLEATGTGLGMRGFYVQLAELYVHLGDKPQALTSLGDAVGRSGWGTRAWDAEIERVRGTALMMGPDPAPNAALSCCRAALDISRVQGARILEVRAAVTCAHILTRLNRRAEAHELLVTYLPFQRPDTVDGAEFQKLIGELTPTTDCA
jgi:class 3 adenylate cyclase/tetratricopeptide (TPR) repeat protein